MENYTLTIKKRIPNPEFDQEKYDSRGRYSQEVFPERYLEEVLNISLSDEQYQKVKKEVLTVF